MVLEPWLTGGDKAGRGLDTCNRELSIIKRACISKVCEYNIRDSPERLTAPTKVNKPVDTGTLIGLTPKKNFKAIVSSKQL